jgi:signal transduction histidine kinase
MTRPVSEPYPLSVTGDVAPARLDPTCNEVDAASARWLRPVAIAAVAIVVVAALRTDPTPGLSGDHLAVSGLLLLLAVGTVAAIGPLSRSPAIEAPLLALLVLAAAALVGVQPNGPGYLAVFPAVVSAALHLPIRRAAVVAGLGVAAIAVAWAVGSTNHSFIAVVLNAFGIVAFFLIALFLRRYREANDRAQRYIVELNESRAAQAEAAALAERQRLAREMHDVLAHSLSGLALNLEGARLMAERTGADPRLTEALQRAQRLAKTGLDEARDAIGMLRGERLPDPARVAELAREFGLDTGVACSCTLEGSQRDLPPDVRLTVYRVAQEALTNVRKHANPERVELHLQFGDAGVELVVEDHGSEGKHRAPGDGTGYGLTGMRERAELLGGTLTAGPTDDGFRVALWIPT